jgi:hypothetical protein
MEMRLHTLSSGLSLDETLRRLAASSQVDGLALFGSSSTTQPDAVSDYDLLILTGHVPVPIFQLLTAIDGRMADVVFVDTKTADLAVQGQQPVISTSFEGLFLQKMVSARIAYDASGRLSRAQQSARDRQQAGTLFAPSTAGEQYADWFFLNHGLQHLKRIARSTDPLYQTAVDLMLLTGLSSLCRVYHRLRNHPWQGEKAALHYLAEADSGYLDLLRACLAETDRERKLALYEALLDRTLVPLGALWPEGVTAVYLRDTPPEQQHLSAALSFWENLIGHTV